MGIQRTVKSLNITVVYSIKTHSTALLTNSLLPQSLMNVDVTQNPGYMVRKSGQYATLWCTPMKGHSHMMWFLHLLEETSSDLCPENVIGSSGMLKKWFSDKFPKENPSILKMEPTELEDSVLKFWPAHYPH